MADSQMAWSILDIESPFAIFLSLSCLGSVCLWVGDGGGLLDWCGGLRLGALSGIHERINPKQNDDGHHHRKPTKPIAYLGFFVFEHLSLSSIVGAGSVTVYG